MTRYARIQDGRAVEFIEPMAGPDGAEVPISERFTPELLETLREAPEGAQLGDVASDDGTYSAYIPPPPTEQEVAADKAARLAVAAAHIAPLQDAVDLEMATVEEVAALKAWKTYRVMLSRVELQEGFPSAVEWPDAPA